MEKWMDGKGLHTDRMMKLIGPIDAGKLAIMQAATERCKEHGRNAANFCFLDAKLVHQLRALDQHSIDPLKTIWRLRPSWSEILCLTVSRCPIDVTQNGD